MEDDRRATSWRPISMISRPRSPTASGPTASFAFPTCRRASSIDSKFPLEAFEALRAAASDEERKLATAQAEADVQKHVKDIAEKYLIPGEVQTPAIMFVPSESIYAELLRPVRRRGAAGAARAGRDRVAACPDAGDQHHPDADEGRQDARTGLCRSSRKSACFFRTSSGWAKRVGNLRQHFDRTNKDIGEIETSMKGIDRHAERIEEVKLGPPETVPQLPPGT